ncbi:Acetyltransferase (GNAT) family protein [compost metagenome]
MTLNIRPYTVSDLDVCLRLFDGNVPQFFAPTEREDFVVFLKNLSLEDAFIVIESDGSVVACGGYVLEDSGISAGLCWGMVERALHAKGFGRVLTDARLKSIREKSGVTRVRLDTSQHSHGFYARFGFRVENVVKDGYGPGLDRLDMVLSL